MTGSGRNRPPLSKAYFQHYPFNHLLAFFLVEPCSLVLPPHFPLPLPLTGICARTPHPSLPPPFIPSGPSRAATRHALALPPSREYLLGALVHGEVVAVQGRLHHAPPALGLDHPLQRRVRLEAHDHVLVLVDVPRAVRGDGRGGRVVAGQHAAAVVLLLEQLQAAAPHLRGSAGGTTRAGTECV